MPCQSFQSMVSYLPGAGKRSLPESRERPFPKARRYGREKYMGGRSGSGCRTNTGGLFRTGRGHGKFRRTAEAPCDGTDGCVPFVLPPRCPASAMQPAEVVENGRRDGTARAPRCKRKTVKALSPTLGIAGESPTRRGTPEQPPAKTAFEHTLKKGRPNIPKFRPYDIYL